MSRARKKRRDMAATQTRKDKTPRDGLRSFTKVLKEESIVLKSIGRVAAGRFVVVDEREAERRAVEKGIKAIGRRA